MEVMESLFKNFFKKKSFRKYEAGPKMNISDPFPSCTDITGKSHFENHQDREDALSTQTENFI